MIAVLLGDRASAVLSFVYVRLHNKELTLLPAVSHTVNEWQWHSERCQLAQGDCAYGKSSHPEQGDHHNVSHAHPRKECVDHLHERIEIGVDMAVERQTKSPKEFESWCRQRDPGGMGWRYENRDQLYHLVK